MFFFLRKKRAKRDAQIEALKKDILQKQDVASATLKKVNQKLARPDTTLMIYYATNGDRRQHHGR